MTSNGFKHQNKGFIDFCDFGLRHTFQERIASKSLEKNQDSQHMKFSALNVSFNSPSLEHLALRKFAHANIKHGHSIKKSLFYRCWLVERENGCR